MLIEELITKRTKETPKEAELAGHKIMLKGSFMHQTGQGIYTLSYLGNLMKRKIEAIVREELNAIGMQEINMPMISPASLWEESGRIDKIDVLAKFQSRYGQEYVINPTHEEIIVDFVKNQIGSYKEYPFCLYQIQSKYRDEKRARGGMLRGREFVMKDAYSFHTSNDDLKKYYEKVRATYHKIYKRLGFQNVIDIESDNGDMGGDIAHEFMMVHEIGEDTLYICDKCGFKANKEIYENNKYDETKCAKCGADIAKKRGVEIGNIFQLGTKYSKSMDLFYIDDNGEKQNPVMGCYGIGITRGLASLFEENHDDYGPIFSINTAPFDIEIIELSSEKKAIKETAVNIYEQLNKFGYNTLYDNREEVRPGAKFADADLIAAPIRLIVSEKNLINNKIEIKYRTVDDTNNLPLEISLEEVNNRLPEIITELKKRANS